MPKARKTKVQSVKEKQEAGEVLSFTDTESELTESELTESELNASSDPVQHKHEDGSAHSHEGGDVSHSHESVPMSKEEFCKEYGIARPGSNHAETEYDNYLLDKFI